MSDQSLRLDAIDKQIIAALSSNARASFAEIGTRVALSAPAVKRRVDRLQREGVVRGFTVVLDPQVFGARTDAFIELYCGNRTNPDAIRTMVSALPEVLAAYTITGEADALLHVRTAGSAELEEVLERIRSHRNVERTKSIIVLSVLVDAAGLAGRLPPRSD